MSEAIRWFTFVLLVTILPVITLGAIRKCKACLQNRIGPPIWQPLFNILKLLRKKEVVSEDASCLIRLAPAVILCLVLSLSLFVPWISGKPVVAGDDLFLVVYTMAAIRFLTMLAALDSGSPFGAFSAPREATLALLVEPAVVLSLVALALGAHSSSLSEIFTFAWQARGPYLPVWILSGLGIFAASLVELSRMPVDDPTTHLELTMVHEAMVIENSGANLALMELAYALRLVIFYGLSAQCFIHALVSFIRLDDLALGLISVMMILALAVLTAVIETVMVKLRWSKVPEFIAYVLTMGLLSSLAALAKVVAP